MAAAVRVVNEAGDRTPHGDGPAQSRQCQFLVKPIAGCPADDAPGEQVDDDGEVEPALAGPHVGDSRPHFWFGPAAAKSWSRRFGAIGKA